MDGRIRNVDLDGVPFPDQTDGAAGGCLGADVADGRAAGRTGKAAIRDECHRGIQLHARQCAGGVEHLAHTGAALGALVADDHYVAGVDVTCVDSRNGGVLAVKDARGAAVDLHFGRNGAALDDTAVRRNVAPQNLQTAGLTVRVVDGADRLVVENLRTADVLSQRFAGDGGNIEVEQVLLRQLSLHRRDAARLIQVGHVGGAGGGQMAEIRRSGGNLVKELQVNRAARLLRNRQQVQHRVGGAAQRHVAGQGVADGALVDDLARGHAAADQVHDGHTGVLGQLQALGVDGGNRAVAGQRDADGLAQAVHAVGRVHAGAGAAARAAVAGAVLKLCVVDHTGLVRADSLEHFGKADLLTAVTACQHRAAGADHGGHVHADGGHDHAGHDLVAVGDQHQTVQLVGHEHRLNAVADQFTAGEGVFHAHMAHSDAVADTDGGDEDGGAACHAHASLDGIGNLIQMGVAGDNLAVGGNDADQRTVQLLRRVAQRIKQAAVWCPLRALFDVIAVHRFSPFSYKMPSPCGGRCREAADEGRPYARRP